MNKRYVNYLKGGGASITLLFLLSLIGWIHQPATASDQNELSTAHHLSQAEERPDIRTTADSISIGWRSGPVSISKIGVDQDHAIQIPHFVNDATPGHYALPQQSILIALDRGAEPEIEIIREVIDTEIEAQNIVVPVAPIPSGVVRDVSGEIVGGRFLPPTAVDQDPSTIPSPIPVAPVTIEEVGTMAGVRLARIRFSPLQISNAGIVTHQIEELELVVHLDRSKNNSGNGVGESGRSDSFQTSQNSSLVKNVKNLVVNPDHVALEPQPPSTRTADFQPDREGVIMEIGESGLISVSYEWLSEQGVDLSTLNLTNLHLMHQGEAIPYLLDGNGDDRFETGEALKFYAPPFFSRWSQTDRYLLVEEATPGLRMGDENAVPNGEPAGQLLQSVTFEEDLIYTPNCVCGAIPAGRDGERWTWGELRLPGQPVWSESFSLQAVDVSQESELTIWLQGITALFQPEDHLVKISLNGAALDEVVWDGKNEIEVNLTVPAGLLISDGTNELSLEILERENISIDGIWIDAFRLAYVAAPQRSGNFSSAERRFAANGVAQRYSLSNGEGWNGSLFNITDPTATRILTPNIENNVLDWRDPAGVTEPQSYFWAGPADEVEPLGAKQARQLTGRSANGGSYIVIAPAEFIPALVPLTSLRANEGWSVVVEPVEAIYDQFGHGLPTPESIRAYLSWAYTEWETRPEMVLLVGDGTNDPKQNLEESLATHIPPYLAVVDPWLGETAADNQFVAIDGDDNLPDMIIGRLPVNSLSETETVVEKIVTYETSPPVGNWSSDILLVADNSDHAGNFASSNESVTAPFLDDSLSVKRLNFNDETSTGEMWNQKVTARWTSGASLIMFNGHASIHQWAVERFMHVDDISSLRNGAQLPVVLGMSCFTSSFQINDEPTLDESLVRSESGGAIAVWGPTGLGVSTGHDALASGYFESVYQENNPRLGDATLAGKLKLAQVQPEYDDLIDTFTLLGDPAMKINMATGRYLSMPWISR